MTYTRPEPLHPANAMGNGYTEQQLRDAYAAGQRDMREAAARFFDSRPGREMFGVEIADEIRALPIETI